MAKQKQCATDRNWSLDRDEVSAIDALHQAHNRLKCMGWKDNLLIFVADARPMPFGFAPFLAIEAGSTHAIECEINKHGRIVSLEVDRPVRTVLYRHYAAGRR